MESSAEAQQIISQAAQWTFEGDCSMLQWMKQISENLEQHVNTTSHSMDALSARVKRTSIALDNAANSLNALQYTQFVESRCHDEDETIASAAEVPVDVATNDNDQPQSSTEVLRAFLQNNLRMLNKSHEKYDLDFEDSDEEDAATNKCIYQPKNPYNDRPLPHIYGSKLWRENWHVGLCDGANDYSGDEISDAFSESSSSAEDNESYESNSAHISEWTSTTSMLHDKHPTIIDVQNASTLGVSTSLQAAAGSDTSFLSSKSAVIQPSNTFEHDLFATLEVTPPIVAQASTGVSAAATRETSRRSSGSNSSKQAALEAKEPKSRGSSGSSASRQESLLYQHTEVPPNDLFAESSMPTLPELVADAERKPDTNPIKRKPVNLFDDDDFNSFMSEIVDRAQQKGDAPAVTPKEAPTETPAKTAPPAAKLTIPVPARRSGRISINLFDSRSNSPEPPEQTVAQAAAVPIPTEQPRDIPKRTPPLNLFDSPEGSPRNEPSFLTPTTTPENNNNVFERKTKITAKSLFDDDDDDDDFLNVFGSKKISVPANPIGKTLLFDDEEDEYNVANKAKEQQITITNKDLFPVSSKEDEEDNIAPVKKVTVTKENEDSEISAKHFSSLKTAAKFTVLNQTDLFAANHDFDQDIFGEPQLKTKEPTDAAIDPIKSMQWQSASIKEDNATPNSATRRPNLFDADLFSANKEEKNNMFSKDDVEGSKKLNIDASDKNPGKSVKHIPIPSTESFLVKESANVNIEIASTTQADIGEVPVAVITTKSTMNVPRDNFAKNPNSSDNNSKTAVEASPDSTKSFSNEVEISKSVSDSVKNTATGEGGFITDIPEIFESTTLPESEMNPTTSSAASNYAGIFLDEPPDDDDFFQSLSSSNLSSAKFNNDLVQEFYEPALPTPPTNTHKETASQVEATASIASDYGGFRLFSEVPPDDDESVADECNISSSGETMTQSKNLHNVFYDDLKETLEAAKQSKELRPPQHSLFDDEPPLEDEDFETNVRDIPAKQAIEEISEVWRENEEMRTEKLSKPNEEVDKFKQLFVDETDKVAIPSADISSLQTETARVTEEKPKIISKLPKLNINVQALLPNAGGKPSFRKTPEANNALSTEANMTNKDPNNHGDVGRLSSTASADVIVANTSQDSGENILTSLCKNRVRVSAKRRPSTRSGRQENYRQSLIYEQQDADVTQQKDEENAALPSPLSADSPAKESLVDTMQEIKNVSATLPDIAKVKNVSQGKSTASAASFLDDIEDDDSFLFGTKQPQQETANVKLTNSFSNIFSETPPDDACLPHLLSTKPIADRAVKIAPAAEITKVTTKNVFSDSDENNDTDDLFQPKSIKQSPTPIEKPVLTPPKEALVKQHLNQRTVELESAKPQTPTIDNTDIVHERSKATPAEPTLTPRERTKVISKNETAKAITPKPAASALQAKPAKSLFSDAESGSDDDLFKSKAATSTNKPTSQAKQAIVTKKIDKLFGSDSDDNDDFLSAFNAKHNKPKSKEQTTKEAQPEQNSRGLFGDAESDEDDLFSSKPTKVTKPAVGQVEKAPAKTTASTKPTNTKVQDNPLADLLK